jgi:poly(A) polymerase
MPSFFKNIKKLFSKPDQAQAPKNTGEVAQKVTQETVQKKPESKATSKEKRPTHFANPYMDKSRAQSINATVIEESTHQINFRDIDFNATKIVKELHKANYESYLVGGCVRDLLLNKRPKDFDVTTGAHPEQAHKVFNRSRLIGRRFKLLHVRFGRDLIEVATFRASHDNNTAENQAKQADSGMILRDNVYGTIDQDALRRDFTINALYYDIKSHCVYDFTKGFEDIEARQIRMIGDPSERYREDPVRMLRAVRFAAKLDFNIEEETAKPIKELASMLFDIAPARLFDEVLKLLQSGHGNESLELLQEYQLLETILPQTAQALDADTENARQLIHNALKNTDRRIKQRKSVSPGFLYAVLLWPSAHSELKKLLAKKRVPPLSALHEVSSKVILEQIKRTSIPKRFSTNIREIWELQLRLSKRPGSKAEQLLEHPRFRAAYDLLLLREKSGEDLDNMSTWWTDYQSATPAEKETLVSQLNDKAPVKKKKRPHTKTAPDKPVFEKFDVVEQVKPQSKARPKKAQEAPKPQTQAVADMSKPVVEQQEDQSVANEPIAKSLEPKESEPKKPEVKKPEPAKAATSEAPRAGESTANEPKHTQSISEPAITVTQPQVEPTPPIETPKPSVAVQSQQEPQQQPQAAVQQIPAPRKKPRRSRAKNDPRNK